MSKKVNINISADGKGVDKAVKDTGKKIEGLKKAGDGDFFGGIGGAIGKIAAIGAAIYGAGKTVADSVAEFSKLEQNIGGAEAVFGKYSGALEKMAWNSAETMGTSASQYLGYANKIGSLFKGMGHTTENALGMTTSAMQRATDVASIMGITQEEALTAIAGMAKGNYTMMDNLGVAMNDTALNAYALEKGIGKTTQQMSMAEKTALAYKMFMDKTTDANGQFAREATTVEGALTRLKANLANAGAMLGQAFAPMVVSVANWLNGFLIPAIMSVIPYVVALANTIARAVGFIFGLLGKLLGFKSAVGGTAKASAGVAKSAGGMSASVGDSAGNMDKASGSAKKLNKELGKLANFDEMNILSESSGSAGSGGSGGGGGGGDVGDMGFGDMDLSAGEGKLDELNRKAEEIAKNIEKVFLDMGKAIGESGTWKAFSAGVISIWENLSVRLGNIFGNIGSIFSELWSGLVKVSIERAPEIDSAFSVAFMGLADLVNGVIALILTPFEGLSAGLSAVLSGQGENIANDLMNILLPTVAFMGNLAGSVGLTFTSIAESGRAGFENMGTLAGQVFMDILSSVGNWTPQILENLGGFSGAMLAIFEGFGTTAGSVWGNFTGGLVKVWSETGGKLLNNIMEMVNNVVKTFKRIADEILAPIIIPFLEEFKKAWKDNIQPMIDEVVRFVVKLIDMALEIYNKFIQPIIDNLINKLAPAFVGVGATIGGVFNTVVKVISDVIGGIFKVLNGLIDFIMGTLTGNWSRAWNGIKDIFGGVFNALAGLVKFPINLIINAINGFTAGLSKIKIPDWVPGVGGKGINIPRIPLLAKGGVIDRPTMAVVGEAGREAVMPLENNTGWISELAGKIAERGGSGGNGETKIVVKIGEETLVDKVIDGINEKTVLNGENMIFV